MARDRKRIKSICYCSNKTANYRRIMVKVEVSADVYDVLDEKGNVIKVGVSQVYRPSYDEVQTAFYLTMKQE